MQELSTCTVWGKDTPTCAWPWVCVGKVRWTMLVAATRCGWVLVTPTEETFGGSGDGAKGSTDPFSSTIPSISPKAYDLKQRIISSNILTKEKSIQYKET